MLLTQISTVNVHFVEKDVRLGHDTFIYRKEIFSDYAFVNPETRLIIVREYVMRRSRSDFNEFSPSLDKQ